MKKIAFLYRGNGFGGIETSLINLVNNLEGWDITVIFFEEDIYNISESFNKEVKVRKEIVDQYSLKKRIKNSKTVYQLIKEIFLRIKIKIFPQKIWEEYEYIVKKMKVIDEEFDIAVTYGFLEPIQNAYINNNIKCLRKIMWVHTDYNYMNNFTYNPESYVKRFDKVFCVSMAAKDIFCSIYPNMKDKTDVFYNLICYEEYMKKAEILKENTMKQEGYKLLTVGRLSSEKGQDMIPAIVERLMLEGFKFCWYLIGSGDLEKYLEIEIIKRKIENHLILIGEKRNPYPYYRDADLYIQTSLNEGYCLAMAEARCFNLPVITTKVSTAAEFVTNGIDGYITEISEEGLYQALKNIFAKPEIFEIISNNSHDTMKISNEQVKKFDELMSMG